MNNNPTNIYFASDLHLGIPNHQESLVREKKFIRWLESIQDDATELYLVGDIFDYWHEYKRVVPKGFVRLLGKLAELRDGGLPIYAFTGNHDLWMFGYFEEELGIPVYKEPIQKTFNNKKFYIGHGDGLGPGDYGYKRLKKLFTNPFCQWAYRQLHPDFSARIAQFSSKKSRLSQIDGDEEHFLGEDKEWLCIFAKEMLEKEHFDYFVFGHRHLPLNIALNTESKYINLGDWITHYSYAKFDGQEIYLRYFEHN